MNRVECSGKHKYIYVSNYRLNESERNRVRLYGESSVKRIDFGSIDCQRPGALVCEKCFKQILIKCKSLKDDKCVPCALAAKRDKKLVMRSGLMRSSMGWLELTLTAPGVDGLPWDVVYCNHSAGMKCSGKLGCKPNEIESAIHNGMMPKNWNRFMQAVRRVFDAEVQYGKVFEAQSRDVLHIHALLTGAPAWPMKRIERVIRLLAKTHGFGGQVSVKRVVGDSPADRQRAIGYVGKYLTKGSKTLQTVNPRTAEIRLGGYRDFTQSRQFGDTLKAVRLARLEHYLKAKSVEEARNAGDRGAETATAIGDAVALDNYKKSYTFRE